MSSSFDSEFERAAQYLEASPDHRVLRRLQPVSRFHALSPSAVSWVGVAVDVETTGLDYETDKIIELAMQRFRYDDAGRIVRVGRSYVWREDPECNLDPRITKLTGLTSSALLGQAIDDDMAAGILSSADLIVAHNAAFDRPFVDKRLPEIAGKAWACSMVELDWLKLGFDGRALAHLVSQCGWFYEGHRAENDILALIYLLAHELPDGRPVLSDLLIHSNRPSFLVNAVDAPFDAKGKLKANGYHWNAILRLWSKEIAASDRGEEEAWLKAEVYRKHGAPAFHPITACDRYRGAN